MFLYLLPFISAIVVTVDKLQRAKPSLCVEHAAEHVFFKRHLNNHFSYSRCTQ